MTFAFQFALEAANELKARLEPHCHRIEIAGSIRRKRSEVHDIDLVCIPRYVSNWSMFAPSKLGDTNFHDLIEKLSPGLKADGQKIIRFDFRGGNTEPGDEPIPVDIYVAIPETWALILLVRTGSEQHNIWMATRAAKLGGRLHADGSCLELPRGPGPQEPGDGPRVNYLHAATEEEIFLALGISGDFIPPERRECVAGRPVWLDGGTQRLTR